MPRPNVISPSVSSGACEIGKWKQVPGVIIYTAGVSACERERRPTTSASAFLVSVYAIVVSLIIGHSVGTDACWSLDPNFIRCY